MKAGIDSLRRAGFRLQFSISVVFALLTVPSFAGFIYWSHASSTSLIDQAARRQIGDTAAVTLDRLVSLLKSVTDSVRIAAQLEAAQAGFFRSRGSDRLLIQELENNSELLSYYAGFDDGSFRQMQRAVPHGTPGGTAPPAAARFASRIVERSAGTVPVERYFYLTADGMDVGETSTGASDYDARTRSFWQMADRLPSHQRKTIAQISEPFVIQSVNQLGLSISAPVFRESRLAAVLAANMTLENLSRFLREHAASANSVTMIATHDGHVVAHPDPNQMIRRDGTASSVLQVSALPDVVLRTAFARRTELALDRFTFRTLADGKEYSALFLPLPAQFGKAWEVVVVAPTDDFIGPLRRNNRMMLAVGVAVILTLLLLMILFARLVARPLVGLTKEIREIEKFSLEGDIALTSKIREVKQLISATQVMKTAMRAFTSYVPRELVRDLLGSGRAIEIGGRSSHLTIMFTDLEGFSSLAEQTPVHALLEQVSAYMGIVTHAVNATTGSVDKFIGDAVMAFWGAPVDDDDHAYHACVAAVRSKRQLAVQNATWRDERRPELRMRVGIHSDAVLVGNIGSRERMSYTVMGDGVNVASRLEGINKEFGTTICVSHAVFRECGERLVLRPIDLISVKGRRGELLVYELFGIRSGCEDLAPSAVEEELCERTRAAYLLMAQNDHAGAAIAYQSIFEDFNDPLAREMMRRCANRRSVENDLLPAATPAASD